MGRHRQVTCDVCCKPMRSDKLKGHMIKHVGDVEVSKKRKSSEGDSPMSVKCPRMSVIAPNSNISQIGTGNDAGSSHQVEPEKEKNPENEAGPQVEPENEYKDKTAFKEKLFQRDYKHRGSHDIPTVGVKYRKRIKKILEYYMKKHKQVTFYQVYKVKLTKFNAEGEEVSVHVFLNSRNRRLLNIQELAKTMTKNLVWKDIYDSLLTCRKNFIFKHPNEFLSIPINGEQLITKNFSPVNHHGAPT